MRTEAEIRECLRFYEFAEKGSKRNCPDGMSPIMTTVVNMTLKWVLGDRSTFDEFYRRSKQTLGKPYAAENN